MHPTIIFLKHKWYYRTGILWWLTFLRVSGQNSSVWLKKITTVAPILFPSTILRSSIQLYWENQQAPQISCMFIFSASPSSNGLIWNSPVPKNAHHAQLSRLSSKASSFTDFTLLPVTARRFLRPSWHFPSGTACGIFLVTVRGCVGERLV